MDETKVLREALASVGGLEVEGAFVQLHVGGLSTLARRTTEVERGLTRDDVRRTLQRAGVSERAPEAQARKLRAIEVRGRQNIARYSYGVLGNGGWQFVPLRAFPRFYEVHEALQAEWAQAVVELREALPAYREQVRTMYGAMADTLWRSARGLADADGLVVLGGKAYEPESLEDREAFSAHVVELGVEGVLTTREVDLAFRFELYEMARQFPNRANRLLDAMAEQRKQRALSEQADGLQAERDLLNRFVMEQIRAGLAEYTDPVTQAVNALRGRILADVNEILTNARNSGRLTGPVATRLRNLVETARLMQVGEDRELMALLERLDTKVASKAGVGPVVEALEEIATIASSEVVTARAQARSANRFASMADEL